jgi:hypothetical protein
MERRKPKDDSLLETSVTAGIMKLSLGGPLCKQAKVFEPIADGFGMLSMGAVLQI